ncbi:MAG: 2Fe-2S iron-sulfur cluster-binding protein, partial [Microcystis aeruginosa]
MTIAVRFLPDDIIMEAETGELLLDVAKKAGIDIPTGCLMGSCHACEVELDDGTQIC